MAGGIFVVENGGGLVELAEQPYDAEEVLQRLIAEHPNLLAGDQISPETPRRWLLVSREIGVPGEEGGGNRWALDHLFLDQEGIPTLVEVKRSSDTRTRREVVGQMLDYAANAVVYWPVGSIRAWFEQTSLRTNRDVSEVLADLLGPDGDIEGYWQLVGQNLRAGRVRLVFIADIIPPELRRIVEFLDEQMKPAEVIAIEIRQYKGTNLQALVPRVVGRSAAAQVAKGGSSQVGKKKWNEREFFDALSQRASPGETQAARDLLAWGVHSGLRIWWGEGASDGSFFPMVDDGIGGQNWTIAVWTSGSVEIQFKQLAFEGRPFAPLDKRLEFLRRLNEIPGVTIPESAIAKRPNIKLERITDPAICQQFISTLNWLVSELRSEVGPTIG